MRRLMTTICLSLSVLVLSVMPALAADEGPVGAESSEGGINGILFALIVGSIVGVALFLDAYRGDPGHREHHGDAAGH